MKRNNKAGSDKGKASITELGYQTPEEHNAISAASSRRVHPARRTSPSNDHQRSNGTVQFKLIFFAWLSTEDD